MSSASSPSLSKEHLFENDSPIPPPTTTGVLPPTAGIMQTQTLEALKDITYGSIAGSLGKVIEYPFDTVKVRLQSQPSGHLRYKGPLDCFAQSIRSEGVSGLYRGISAPLFGAAVETSSLFFSYRIAQAGVSSLLYPQSDARLPLSGLVLCGALSGAFTSLLLTPIELVKCQMQVPLSEQARIGTLRSPISIISEVFRTRGVLGFWHGQLGTLIRETGGSAAWFGSYEGVTAFFKARASSNETTSLPIWQSLLAGATAGMTYNFLFFPADTVKSRQQTASFEGQKRFMDVSRALYAEYGVRGFYRGCGITVARAAPSSAFIFTVYEGLRNWLG